MSDLHIPSPTPSVSPSESCNDDDLDESVEVNVANLLWDELGRGWNKNPKLPIENRESFDEVAMKIHLLYRTYRRSGGIIK